MFGQFYNHLKNGIKKASAFIGRMLERFMVLLYLNNFYIYRVHAFSSVLYFVVHFVVLTDFIDKA